MSKESAMAAITGAPAPVITKTPENVISEPVNNTPQPNTSDAFAQIAKKESERVRKEQQLKIDREAFQKEKAEAQAIIQKENEFQSLKQKDVVQALKLKGFSEQDIFNYLADQQPKELTPEEKAAKAASEAADAKIKAWEDQQKKEKEEARAKADSSLITGFKGTIAKTIEAEKDKYEYCAHYGEMANDLVYETVLAIIKDAKGEGIPEPRELRKQAIDLVEEYYEEQDKAMSTIKKRNPNPAPAKEEPTKAPERTRTVTDVRGEPVAPTITKTRTLSNGAVATAASALRNRTETKDQKRERLINALREGKLA